MADRCEDMPVAERSGNDICACGDRRDQHQNGTGRCNLGSLCTPGHCQRFRLFQTAAEHEASEQRLREATSRRKSDA